MARACAERPGTMAALVRLDPDQVEHLVADVEGAVIANDNAPGQVVVAGPEEAVDRASALAREAGGRALPIEVEGAFHSPAMEPAVPAVAEFVASLELRDPEVPLVSGTTAAPVTTAAEIATALVEGILAPVRWREVQLALQAQGVATLLELGPGGVLKGLAKRTVGELEVLTVGTPEQAEHAAVALTARAH